MAQPAAQEKFEADGFFGIFVGDGLEKFADLDFDAEFLQQFALQAIFIGFTGMAFAAGKFPQAAQMRLRAALGDQEQAVAENQAGGDIDGVWMRTHGGALSPVMLQRPMLL